MAVWRTIWEQNEHVVVRVYHTDRRVRFADGQGGWPQGSIAQARAQLRLLARARTMLEVQKRGQPRAKRQAVTTEIWACPLQVSYETNVRRSGPGTSVTKTVWLVEVRLLDTAGNRGRRHEHSSMSVTSWAAADWDTAITGFNVLLCAIH